MADLDVSDILLDPDFCEQITVNRTTQTVGTNGRVVNTVTPLTPYAVVTMGPMKGVVRSSDYTVSNGTITVHTQGFRLLGPQPGIQPDVVIWGGDPYVVVQSFNWSHFGTGFTAAECELQKTVTTS